MRSVAPAVLVLMVLTIRAGAELAAGKSAGTTDRFDGAWRVEVVTEAGVCGRTALEGLRVENGKPSYAGSAFKVSGRIAPDGAVQGTISNGVASANVSGTLAHGGRGTGVWKAEGIVRCRGRWRAERRG